MYVCEQNQENCIELEIKREKKNKFGKANYKILEKIYGDLKNGGLFYLELPNDYQILNKYLKPGVVVSMTRIEPPLHPDGPEKILADYGIEPEEFNEQQFLNDLSKI